MTVLDSVEYKLYRSETIQCLNCRKKIAWNWGGNSKSLRECTWNFFQLFLANKNLINWAERQTGPKSLSDFSYLRVNLILHLLIRSSAIIIQLILKNCFAVCGVWEQEKELWYNMDRLEKKSQAVSFVKLYYALF